MNLLYSVKVFNLLLQFSKVTGESKIKKSVVKLIEEYGAPVTNILGNAPVHISDLSLNSYDFCRRVLDFQYSLVYKHIQENSLDSYLKYVSNSSLQEDFQQLHPKFLIAPYFYLDDTSSEFDQWLSLNRKFAELSIEISKNLYNKKDIFVQLVINKSVLTNSVAIEKIAQTYKKLAIAGLTIWVDDLNEQEASLQELQGFVNLLSQLPSIPKYNMYGGYFSVLLTHKSIGLLEGVSHGLEYGESRKVIQ